MHKVENHRDETTTIKKDPYMVKPVRWQVVVVRAVVAGDLPAFISEATIHPEAIHEAFTKSMEPWELQWEAHMWYEFVDVPCLYLASSYAQPAIVRWLLENGADPQVPGFATQLPVDVVGQCRGTPQDVEDVRQLLGKPLAVLKAPKAPVATTKAGPEDVYHEVLEKVPSEVPDAPPLEITRRVKQREVLARITVDWRACHWLPPGTVYEMRRRVEGQEDWVYDRCSAPYKVLDLLPLNQKHQFQVRGQNRAGWSGWSPAVSITTPSASTR